MGTRSGPARQGLATAVATLFLTLTACSGDSSSATADGPSATGSTSSSAATPGPTTEASAAQRRLHRGVVRLRKSSHLSITTTIVYGTTYRQSMAGRYQVAGNRFDASVQELTGGKPTGFEVYHRDGTTVLRLLSGTQGCWWQAAGSPAGSYAAPVPPQLQALLGARATGRRGPVLEGTLPATALAAVLESPVRRLRDHLTPSAGARVAGTFVMRDGIVSEFDTTVARVLRSSGVTPPDTTGRDSWIMTWSLDQTSPIQDPPADRILQVHEDDPHRAARVAACTARTR